MYLPSRPENPISVRSHSTKSSSPRSMVSISLVHLVRGEGMNASMSGDRLNCHLINA